MGMTRKLIFPLLSALKIIDVKPVNCGMTKENRNKPFRDYYNVNIPSGINSVDIFEFQKSDCNIKRPIKCFTTSSCHSSNQNQFEKHHNEERDSKKPCFDSPNEFLTLFKEEFGNIAFLFPAEKNMIVKNNLVSNYLKAVEKNLKKSKLDNYFVSWIINMVTRYYLCCESEKKKILYSDMTEKIFLALTEKDISNFFTKINKDIFACSAFIRGLENLITEIEKFDYNKKRSYSDYFSKENLGNRSYSDSKPFDFKIVDLYKNLLIRTIKMIITQLSSYDIYFNNRSLDNISNICKSQNLFEVRPTDNIDDNINNIESILTILITDKNGNFRIF